MEDLVSVDWLKTHLNDEDLVILDTSPKSTVSGASSSFQDSSIPRSRYFDIKGNFTNKESSFPNTVPSSQQFEQEAQKLGITKTSKIVVYDNLGIYTSPRAWWLFKIMGHDKVAVLDGGLPEWIEKGYDTIPKTEVNKLKGNIGNFETQFESKWVKTYQEVLDNTHSNSFLLIDARSQGRFNGTKPEPRKHLKSGKIPNSLNIPYQEVLENGKFKSIEELKTIFAAKCSPSQDLVFSCGSGLTACIVMLASEIAFKKSKYIYDGSWTEWAELQNLKTTK